MPVPDHIGYADKYEVAPTSAIDRSGVRTLAEWMEMVQSGFGYTLTSGFGAVGDDVIDDTDAFNDAAATGRLVFIPPPPVRYKLSTTVGPSVGTWLPDPSIPWDELTDGGQFNMWRGRATELTIPGGANIWRLSDRVFVGGAASQFAGNSLSGDEGNSWYTDSTTAPLYLGVNAGVLLVNGGADPAAPVRNQPYGFVSALSTTVAGQGVIGFGAAIVGDLASTSAWGFMAELQRESGAGQLYGIEVSAKNKGNNQTITPNAQTSGVFGTWLAAGGDDAFGGASANPSTAAVVVLDNTNTWNTGIVFMKDALTAGNAISMSSEGTGGAHHLRWTNAAGNLVFIFRSTATDSTQWIVGRDNSGLTVNNGSSTVFTVGASKFSVLLANLVAYADDAAAAVGGLSVGDLYRTGSAIKVRAA